MRSWLPAALFLLAGCSTPGTQLVGSTDCDQVPMPEISSFAEGADRSKETLGIFVTASGGFVVDVPAPTSSDGTRMAHWAANASAPPGWTVREADSGRGKALRIEGSGSGTVSSCAVQPARGGNNCCAEQYLGARWSNDPNGRPESIPVHVIDGGVSVQLVYEAGSNYCGANADFAAAGLGEGWHDVPGHAEAFCT